MKDLATGQLDDLRGAMLKAVEENDGLVSWRHPDRPPLSWSQNFTKPLNTWNQGKKILESVAETSKCSIKKENLLPH